MAKEKKAKYDIIDPESEEGAEVFEIYEEAKERWCSHLMDCRFALIWMNDVKPDKDGHLVLGRNKPVSEEDRELHNYDRKIELNRATWGFFSREQKLALVHHELLHTDQAVDKDGEPRIDGHGKLKWRGVKHDLEEFRAIVREHGLWISNLVAFAEAMVEGSPQLQMFTDIEKEGDSGSQADGGMDWARDSSGAPIDFAARKARVG